MSRAKQAFRDWLAVWAAISVMVIGGAFITLLVYIVLIPLLWMLANHLLASIAVGAAVVLGLSYLIAYATVE